MNQEIQFFWGNRVASIVTISLNKLSASVDKNDNFIGKKINVEIIFSTDPNTPHIKIYGIITNIQDSTGDSNKVIATLAYIRVINNHELIDLVNKQNQTNIIISKINNKNDNAKNVDDIKHRHKKSRGYVLISCFVFIFMVIASKVIWHAAFNIDISPPFAAVTVPLNSITAPDSGIFTWNNIINDGDFVATNQLLGTINSPNLQAKKIQLEGQLSELKGNIAKLQQTQKESEQFFTYYIQNTQNTLIERKNHLENMKIALKIEQEHNKRLKILQKKGYATIGQIDNAKLKLNDIKNDTEAAENALNQATIQMQMAKQYYLPQPNSAQKSPAEIQQDINDKTIQYNNLLKEYQVITSHYNNMKIISPCDCKVIQSIGNNQWINQGSTIIYLHDTNSKQLTIEARLPVYLANRVQNGYTATVTLDKSDTTIQAKVVQTRAVSNINKRYGLPNQITQDPSLTSIYLLPISGHLSPDNIGVLARISVDTYMGSTLRHLLPKLR